MLAAAIALHLAVAQASAVEEPLPPPPPAASEPPLPDRPDAEPLRPVWEDGPASLPPRDEGADELKVDREPPRPGSLRARQIAKSALEPIPSFLTAESFGGRSAVGLWAGWSSVGAGWAQGLTSEDDLGVLGDLDWSTGELRVSAFYRRPMGRVGLFDIGARMRAGWYSDFGARWFQDDNLKDRGVEVVPGLVVSTRGAKGVFALGGDLPIVVTLWRNGGIFASPRATLSYETLLYGDLTVGARIGVAYRAGAGDAPMRDPRSLLEFGVMAGWKLF